MDVYNRLLDIRHIVEDIRNQGINFLRVAVTDGVGDIYGARARGDGGLDHPVEKIPFAAGGVFRRKFNVRAELTRQASGFNRQFKDFFLGLTKLILEVNLGNSQEKVYPRAPGLPYGVTRGFNIRFNAAGQAADRASFNLFSDYLHGVKIAGAGDRKTGLDHIYAQLLKL